MDSFVSFLVKSMACCAALTAYYWLFLRNKKFHNFNRLYLLSAIVVSLVLPLLRFSWFPVGVPVYEAAGHLLQKVQEVPTLMAIIQTISLLGSAVLLIVFIIKIGRLYLIKKCSRHIRMNGFTLIETEIKQAPFSFLNNLYWRTDISMDDENGKKIYQHELIHIREKHTYDKLFSQFIVCMFWMNPFYWIIRKELNMVHEFIADAGSVGDGDTESFAAMLLRSYQHGKYLDPAHFFSHSPVRRRLSMVADRRRTAFSFWRKFSALPVTLILILVIAYVSAVAQKNSKENKQLEAKMAAEKAALQTGNRIRKI